MVMLLLVEYNHFILLALYFFQMVGIHKKGKWGKLDYSSLDLDDLDELHLNEKAGLDAISGDDSVLFGYGTSYFCPDGTQRNIKRSLRKVDWNCNGNNEEIDVSNDIGGYFGYQMLIGGINEWKLINYKGGSIGSPGVISLAEKDFNFTMDELTYEDAMTIMNSHSLEDVMEMNDDNDN